MGFDYRFNSMHIVRGLQGLLALITLGLLAHVAQWFNSNAISLSETTPATHVPTQIIFAIFVSVLTILITLPYVLLTPRYFPHLFAPYTKYTILALEILSFIFWFAAFLAVSVFLGKLSVCRGDVCGAAKAGAGISAISFVMWGVTSLFALRFCFGGNGDEGIAKGERKRERVLRGLRLHNVWAGRGGDGNGNTREGQMERTGHQQRSWELDSYQNRI